MKRKKLIVNPVTKEFEYEKIRESRAKRFLKRNTIYLKSTTTILSLILSFTGIIISSCSVRIQENVSKIQQIQFQKQEEASKPQFNVFYQIHDEKYAVNGKEYSSGIECTIRNIGGKIVNPMMHAYSYYSIFVMNWDGKKNEKIGDSPVLFNSSNSKKFNVQTEGIIISEKSYEDKEGEFTVNIIHKKKIDNFYSSLVNKMKKGIKNKFSIDESICVEIEYWDIYNEYHKEWYELLGNGIYPINQPSLDFIRRVNVKSLNNEEFYINVINELERQDIDDIIKLNEE